jgi:single-strand DNA-binding protein
MSNFSINRVEILGNIGKDPIIKTATNGKAFVNLSVATENSYKKGDDWENQTIWHSVSFFDKLAERAEKALKKGEKVYVEGKLSYSKIEKNGITTYNTSIIAYNFIGLGKSERNNTQPLNIDNFYEQAPEQADNYVNLDNEVPF